MTDYMKRLAPFALAVLFFTTACNDSKVTSEEETEITTMDSTSKVVNEKREALEDQTKKVEESLEKLDNEFDSTN